MKKNLGIVLVACVLVVSGIAFSQDPAQDAGDPKLERVDRLERDLVDSRARTEALAAELLETKARLAEVASYLADQSQSAKALAATLDASEVAGFTYGINPESRHILLRGWRAHLGVLQSGVPALVTPKPAAKSDAKTTKPANGG